MVPDKSWMDLPTKSCIEYANGVEQFLEYAYQHVQPGDTKIRCPCVDCSNRYNRSRDEVARHLLKRGMKRNYTLWYLHGESEIDESGSEDESDDDSSEMEYIDNMVNMLNDVYPNINSPVERSAEPEEPNASAKEFYRLLEEAKQPLYEKCDTYSNLSFIINLMHIKSMCGWSDKSIDLLLKVLTKAFPMCQKLPDSHYGATKVISGLGLEYVKIDACPNDCMIYYKENEKHTSCQTCGHARWKASKVERKVPYKVLRYFPLTPRLQRLYMSTKTAEHMRWHHEKRAKDGVLRHPADGEAWKDFDKKHKSFSSESRNVRLCLATDGFNPFSNMNLKQSLWPVLICPYNLPPWMCMKEPYTFMTLLIPGPSSPGNNIDVYLRPLIDELCELWENGIDTYDSSKKENFQMKAALMWTIHDFPAYGDVSGWSTKGKLACPPCASNTEHLWLKHSRKTCYMGSRRFLPEGHPWRSQKAHFDGKCENRTAPKRLSGDDILKQYESFEQVEFGKKVKGAEHGKRKKNSSNPNGFGITHNWKKHSIFFKLPYWKTLMLRHNLDVMHIEKNIFDSAFGTIMNIDGKTKDTTYSRLDMQEIGIRKPLHLKEDDKGKSYSPAACYMLSKEERKILCEWLENISFPDGYAANLSRCVNVGENKISGMKTHDCHVFLEKLLPLAVRELLPKTVSDALIELSMFFKELCSKVLEVESLEHLDRQIVLTLCKLEKIFPPSFFDIMLHLPIHLCWEAKVGGPVQYRWMYFCERYMKKFKGYVRNKARPDGSIAEGYLVDECITFCSQYLDGIETMFNRAERNSDGSPTTSPTASTMSIFSTLGQPFGKSTTKELSNDLQEAARFYVLQNCKEVEPFAQEHKNEIASRGASNIDEVHKREFSMWFEKRITQLYNDEREHIDIHMLALARGPEKRASFYSGYNVNGFRFRTRERDENRISQNSGVMVKGENSEMSVPYYGVLKDIVELRYTEGNSVVLFDCEWYDVVREGTGYKIDRHGIVSINRRRKLNTDEPFVLACQSGQVYFVDGLKDRSWSAVIETKPRNLYETPIENDEPYQEDQTSCNNYTSPTNDQNIEFEWTREEEEDMIVD